MNDFASHDADELAHRARLVRGLVQALVADADDVEQQVWLAAVQKPPHEGFCWKAWVVGVVRHLKLTLARERGRRSFCYLPGSTMTMPNCRPGSVTTQSISPAFP